MKKYIIKLKRLIVSEKTGEWCKIPYPNHPKGCPKYGNDKACPPHAPKLDEFFDLSKPLYFVHSEFNLKAHVERMKQKYKLWSDRQCRCVLYWQGTSRKQLRERAEEAAWSLGTNAITACPEGMGVNVYATARVSGLCLQRIRGLKICRHIAMIGFQTPQYFN